MELSLRDSAYVILPNLLFIILAFFGFWHYDIVFIMCIEMAVVTLLLSAEALATKRFTESGGTFGMLKGYCVDTAPAWRVKLSLLSWFLPVTFFAIFWCMVVSFFLGEGGFPQLFFEGNWGYLVVPTLLILSGHLALFVQGFWRRRRMGAVPVWELLAAYLKWVVPTMLAVTLATVAMPFSGTGARIYGAGLDPAQYSFAYVTPVYGYYVILMVIIKTAFELFLAACLLPNDVKINAAKLRARLHPTDPAHFVPRSSRR